MVCFRSVNQHGFNSSWALRVLFLAILSLAVFWVCNARAQGAFSPEDADIQGQRPETARPTFFVGIPENRPPISFLPESGVMPRGLAVDLALMLGAQLKHDVRFVLDSPGGLHRRLQNREIDFIVGISLYRTRKEGTKALITPFVMNRRILVAAPETHISCEDDYLNRRILLVVGDPYIEVVQREGGIVVLAATSQEAVQRLVAGEAEAFVAQSGEVASYMAQRMNHAEVKLMGLSLERIPFIIEVFKPNDDLFNSLSNALTELEASRKLDPLREKWLGRSLASQSFWELYQKPILTALAGVCIFVFLIISWISTLRRQITRITHRLRSSEKRYRELIEASPDMTLLLTPNASINLANRVARENLNLEPETENGSFALWTALNAEGKEQFRQLISASSQGISRKEIVLHPDRENMRIMEFIAFLTESAHGDGHLVCCIGRDITKRRRLETELIEVERLAIIGKTAASVAHEINNPLGIIMAHTDVAMEEADAPAIRGHLEAIHRNVERAAKSTNRLLNIAMPTSIMREPQNLAYIIKESLAYLNPRMRKVRVNLEALDADLIMPGDRTLLEQVYINLLLNALESMNDEGELIVCGHVAQKDGKRILRVEVQDSGPGIAPENMEKIFDPFFTTRGSKGFGLGLFISRRIVEAHGGSLSAHSDWGSGATMITEFCLE